jgi:hypothetical protein
MSNSSRTGLVLIIVSIVASVVFILQSNEQNKPVTKVSDESPETASDQLLKAEPKDSQPASQETDNVASTKEAHGANCSHCAKEKKTSREAPPQLVTSPDADGVFKKLAGMKERYIPSDTFDFLRGSQAGDPVKIELGELEFHGTVSMATENHPKARRYSIKLDDDLGRVMVRTDAAGSLSASIFFYGDSRVVQTKSVRGEGSGESLVVWETTVASIVCGTQDTIMTKDGFRSASGQGMLLAPNSSKPTQAASSELSIPSFQSRPSSEYVIYLAFDGEEAVDTLWNNEDNDPIIAEPVPLAGEDEWVELVWRRVAEDFAPFDINVTTNESVFNDPDQDVTKRVQVVISTSTEATGEDFGGIAFLHSFREDSPICWVRNDTEYTCATTISHEVGHTLGLEHDGLGIIGEPDYVEYYPGHNGSYEPGWAPIMGAGFLDGFYDEVDQWSIGDYADASNTENDLAVIGDDIDPQDDHIPFPQLTTDASNGFGFVADDYADNFNEESGLGPFQIIDDTTIQASGLISSGTDVDVFEFSAPEGEIRFNILSLDVNSVYTDPGSESSGANLAVNAQLLDSNGQLIADGVPAGENLMSALIETSVDGGTYYLKVDGGGRGSGATTGFTDYGSLGEYTIVGELALPPLAVFGGPKQTLAIFNGATNVDSSNGTDFGFSTPGGSVAKTFRLENSGQTVDITNLQVDLAGESPSQFSVSGPNLNTFLPGNGDFFDVNYTPTTTGTHSATVVVTYQAGNSQVFEFRVRGSATTSSSVDNYEPNNNANAAYNLNAFESVWLEDIEGLAFFLSDEIDFYKFTAAPEDDLIRIDTSLSADAQNVRFDLVHFNGVRDVTVASTNRSGQLQYIIPEEYGAGTREFYIRVSTTDDSTVRNVYDLRWSSIELVAGSDDLYEENDTREDAFDLTDLGTQLSQTLGLAVSDDEDWYKITIPRDPFIRMLYVSALFDHDEGDIDIEVYRETVLEEFSATNEDKEMVTYHEQIDFEDYPESFTYSPEGNFLVMGVSPGTYYIRVTGDLAGNTYDLIVDPRSDDRYEVLEDGETENDSINNPFPLGEEIVGQWLSDVDGVGTSAFYPESATSTNFANSADPDWYAFSIGGTDAIGQLSLDFRSFDGGTFLFYLYDASGQEIASSPNDLTTLGVLNVNNPEGRDFFIQVIPFGSASVLSGYDFRVDFTNQPPLIEDPEEDNYEENDNFQELYNISSNEGRYLSSIDGYGTQLDADWYQINVPQNAAELEASLVFVNADGDLDLSLSRKDGPQLFLANNGGDTETIVWENPDAGQYALTVTGENNGNFYNLLWDITFSEDNYEENDTLGQAFDITGFENRLLNKLNGIAIQADEDWYKISADADTVELRAGITFTHSEGDIDLALYNAGGALIDRSISTTNNETLVYADPPAGDYYLRVYFGNESNEYDLTWSALSQEELDLIPTGDDDYEQNDTINNPFVFAESEKRLSRMQGRALQKDEDWYEFEVPEDNVGLRVEALFEDNRGDIDIEVYDPLGFPLAVRDSIDDNELLLLDSPVPQGVYSVRVYGPDLGNDYDLYINPFVEDIFEENDDSGEAYDISLLLGSPLSNEGVPTLGDDDWYVFEVSRSLPFISVVLNYQEIDGAIDFELRDSSLNVIRTADSLNDTESVLEPVENGTYYVRVFGDNAYNTYDLEVDVIGDDIYEENDVSGDAADITEEPSIQAVQFDDDWYLFEVTDTSENFLSVSATFAHANGNIDLDLYKSTDLNTPIESATSESDDESLRVAGDAGIYYIHVTGDNTNPAYQLSWSVAPDDQFEQNDTLEDATSLLGSEGVEITALQFDADWYEISAGPGKLRLVVDLFFQDALGDLSLTLYNSAGEELAFADSATSNEQINYSLFPFGSAAETYYLKVQGASVGTEYGLVWQTSIEDNFEGDSGNNTYQTASDDLLDAEGQRISDTIGYGGALNDDWYKVQINPGDDGLVIEAFFEHAEDNNIDLELFGDGDLFLRRSAGFSDVERIHYIGAPGTYYLRVFGTSSEKPYDLVWNSYAEDDLELAFTDPNRFNDIPDTPRSLSSSILNFNSRGSSDLEFAKLDDLTLLDEDWYEFTIDEGEDVFNLELEFEHSQGDIDAAVYQLVYDEEFELLEVNLVGQSESLTDSETITLVNLPPNFPTGPDATGGFYEYLICIYGYGIYNEKSDLGWTFDPYTEDYSPFEDNPDPAGNSYYDLDEANARGLGNTYSMRWRSYAEDEYEENDSFGSAAEPTLIDQEGNEDSDGVIDDGARFFSGTNCEGEAVMNEYNPVYRYPQLDATDESKYRYLTQLDDDWYKFTIDTGGNHSFYAAINSYALDSNLDLYLYDASNNLLDSSESEFSDSEVVEIQGSGRTEYYIKVVGQDRGTPYDLEVRGFFDDRFEENDTTTDVDGNVRANITDLCGVSITGLVQRDDDLFRVDIPKDNVHLTFDADGFIGGLQTEVLDSEGNPLDPGFERSGNTGRISSLSRGVIPPEAGTYYLKVTGDDAGQTYDLNWTYNNVDEYEFGDSGFYYSDSDMYEGRIGNDVPDNAFELTRLRLEPVYNPQSTYQPPIKEFAFNYDLLDNLYFRDGLLQDSFGHAILEEDGEDWYAIQIPSWFLRTARKGNQNVQVLKREYYVRLRAEIEFVHLDGDINMEIYDETDLSTPLGRSATSEDIESLTVAVDPTSEARTYYIRVYGGENRGDAENHYSLKWDVVREDLEAPPQEQAFAAEDAYEELEDLNPENDTNNFANMAYDLTNADGASTENTWLHEIEYLQDVNGDGVVDARDDGIKSAKGYGKQRTDDWYAVVVSDGATQIEVECLFYSDNDTGYEYEPDDLDIDFEVYYLAGDDGNPATRDVRKPVLVGRSIESTDDTLFSSDGTEARGLTEDITTEISEMAVFDVDESGIYLIRIYYDNRSHPYTFRWDDLGDTDNSGDSAIIEEYLTGNWSFQLPDDLPSNSLQDPYGNPDGDRFLNWTEFALGLDPAVNDYVIIGKSIVELNGQDYFQFEYIRNVEAEALGYGFIVQESEDLNFGEQEAVFVRKEPVDGSAELERVVYRSSAPISEKPKCFFRLVVNDTEQEK